MNNNYEIGYGKPPKKSQFKPGQSGNPKGRPKIPRDYFEDINEALGEEISMIENGKKKIITYRQAMIKQTINKAIRGDLPSTKYLLEKDDVGYRKKLKKEVCMEEPDLSTEELAAEAVMKMLQRVNEDY